MAKAGNGVRGAGGASPWPGYPRRVDLGRQLVAEVALVDLPGPPGAMGVTVDTDHLTMTLPVDLVAVAHDGSLRVSEAQLVEAIASALRMGACEMMTADRAYASRKAQAITLAAEASALLGTAPGAVGLLPSGVDHVRDLIARAVLLLGC